MNIDEHPHIDESPPRRRFWIYTAFGLLWVIFYLATPLSVRFTESETFHAGVGEASDEERAEINADEVSQGSLPRELSLATLALFGAGCLILPANRRVRIQGLGGIVILGFLLWTAASVVWSGEMSTTLRKQAVLTCLAVAALGVAKQFSLRQIAWFAVFAGGMLLTVGLCSELVLGNFQPLDSEYRFSGLTWPAFNAWMLSLLLLGSAVIAPDATKHRKALALLCCAAVGAVVMTKTRAGAAGLVAGLAVYAALTWSSRRALVGLLAVVACTAASILLLSLATPNAGDTLVDVVNLGRAESAEGISGRSQLWEDLMPFIADRPLIGYGYDSFWTPDHLVKIGEDNWGAPDAHNGYINLTLGIGIIGAAAFVLVMLSGFCRSWIRYRQTRAAEYAFACGVIVVTAINMGFVSTQLAPTLYAFITLAVLAHLGFIEDRIQPSAQPV